MPYVHVSCLAWTRAVWLIADRQVHPNYEGKYEPGHAPRMNQGVVIKTNANQRYTSNAPTTFLLRRIAKKGGIKVQDFEIRNDSVSLSLSLRLCILLSSMPYRLLG